MVPHRTNSTKNWSKISLFSRVVEIIKTGEKSVAKEYPPSLTGRKLHKIIFLGLAKDPTEV